jgi:NadR type nicotinamide-nucleotide adenylyltransferase
MEAKGEIKKIVILGPESTGKSTLCEQLAAHYNTVWVREYAREYLEKNGTDYTFENLYEIAMGQLEGEQLAVDSWQLAREMTNDERRMTNEVPTTNNQQPIFIDTDLYVMKVWSEFVFDKCDNRILTQITKRKYDLYLLCNTDLPWVADNLREYPDLESREKLFHHYKEQMTEQHVPWVIISGGYEERLAMAVNVVDKLLHG